MKPVYAVQCRFVGDDAETLVKEAWGQVVSWLEEITKISDIGSQLAAVGDVNIQIPAGGSVRRLEISMGQKFLRKVEHVIPPNPMSSNGWSTNVWICRDSDLVWGVVRSGPNHQPGIINRITYQARRPGVVGKWIDNMNVIADGYRLSSNSWNWGLGDFEKFKNLLESSSRRLPIVGISKFNNDEKQQTLLDPSWLAKSLSGLAHVVVLDRALSWEISNEFGKQYGVYNGGLRVWWPHFQRGEDQFRHVLIMPDQIQTSPQRTERFVVDRIWDLAVDAISNPPLEATLLREVSRYSWNLRMENVRKSVAENSVNEEALLEELEKQYVHSESLEEQVSSLLAENEDLRDELFRSKSGQLDSEFELDVEVDSVEDAVAIAASESENVVYLPNAFASARESQYPNPKQVLLDLRAINRVAKRWRDGEMSGDFRSAFDTESVKFAPFISDTAQRRFRVDYEIDVAGQTVLMGPHLRRGIGAPIAILRVYWYIDDSTKQFFVGHVGRKLRDDSNN